MKMILANILKMYSAGFWDLDLGTHVNKVIIKINLLFSNKCCL